MGGVIDGFVPIVAIFMSMLTVIVISIAIIVAGMRKRKLEIEAYKTAIEKGLPVPELKTMQKSPISTFKASLIWIAIGIGFSLMMLTQDDRTAQAFGLIPLLIGIALMISYFMEKREREKEKEQEVSNV